MEPWITTLEVEHLASKHRGGLAWWLQTRAAADPRVEQDRDTKGERNMTKDLHLEQDLLDL